ncbi:MAG: hypothetical protein FJ290_30085 [Planctomycetes bacterium]|nr:hypothetical protein [Planctomycetota bacterium]
MRFRALCLGLAACLAVAARADLVTLKSGEILEGKARQFGGRVFFWNRYGEEHNFHREEFFWLRLCDFNVAKWRGAEKEYYHPLKTRFPDAGAPEPPQKPTVSYHMPIERKAVELWWDRSPSPDIARYNVYQKVGDGDEEVEPFRLVAVVDPARFQPKQRIGHGGLKYHEKFEEHGFYTLDTWFAVTAVAADGRESGLSDIVHVPWFGETRRAAVLPDGRVIFSADRHPSLYWSPGNGGVREFGVRTAYLVTRFPFRTLKVPLD